ncbi:PRKR-interacting protein 1 homolog [Caerostris extrusa]|uniref:PRKR-interacting protein 1 homolog n=1 Tax=Caerostris extrusa TaxID=172846 RepID=A0AAV4SXC0_CAEEX|nr:PRKR-interacting protein 1 homolog [Caerostris extrusa]
MDYNYGVFSLLNWDEVTCFVSENSSGLSENKIRKTNGESEKPVIIPEMPKEKKGFTVPEFVRNVMGSSAGAGSGEFHVYRHLRRKEYTRQKIIDEMGEQKIGRANSKEKSKRLRKKAKRKMLKTSKVAAKPEEKKQSSSEEEESSEDENSNADLASDKIPLPISLESNQENENTKPSKEEA